MQAQMELEKQFQSTLPRGSDAKAAVIDIKRLISIHAPSRERRASALSANYNIGISIHAPSRERPVTTFLIVATLARFQSTLPRGSDPK